MVLAHKVRSGRSRNLFETKEEAFMKVRRKILLGFIIILLPPVMWVGCLIWHNNRTVEPPSSKVLSESLERAVQWLAANRVNIVNNNNAMFWWMIDESANLTQDQRLHIRVVEYNTRHIIPYPRSPWHHLFDRNSTVPVDFLKPNQMPDYKLHIIYGLTCDSELGGLEIIKYQNQEDYCGDFRPTSPACVTHQLMAVRFMQDRKCGEKVKLQDFAGALQDKIVSQLTWDPRVVDVYIQRVLMLTESGVKERVKPAWLTNVLNAQLEDGGWSDFQPLIPLGSSNYFGFTSQGMGIRKHKSTFQATAQGIFLMSLLLNSSD
jgi:hypothetical protein